MILEPIFSTGSLGQLDLIGMSPHVLGLFSHCMSVTELVLHHRMCWGRCRFYIIGCAGVGAGFTS